MGFFSGIFGTTSEWTANNFVSKTVGKKYWHKSFIDLDEMRKYGIQIAFQMMPTSLTLNEGQSQKTIVGEMIFLYKQCEVSGDDVGIRAVINSIAKLLEDHENVLPKSSRAIFTVECYNPLLLELIQK